MRLSPPLEHQTAKQGSGKQWGTDGRFANAGGSCGRREPETRHIPAEAPAFELFVYEATNLSESIPVETNKDIPK